MAIWHKRKRKVPLAYAIPTLALILGLWAADHKLAVYDRTNQETTHSRCSQEEIINYMDGIIEEQDYNPRFVPPPRRPG